MPQLPLSLGGHTHPVVGSGTACVDGPQKGRPELHAVPTKVSVSYSVQRRDKTQRPGFSPPEMKDTLYFLPNFPSFSSFLVGAFWSLGSGCGEAGLTDNLANLLCGLSFNVAVSPGASPQPFSSAGRRHCMVGCSDTWALVGPGVILASSNCSSLLLLNIKEDDNGAQGTVGTKRMKIL